MAQNGNFSTEDFIAFVRCYVCYSKTLSEVFEVMSAAAATEREAQRQSQGSAGAPPLPFDEDGMHLGGDDHAAMHLGSGDGGEDGGERESEVEVKEQHREQTRSRQDPAQRHLSQEESCRNVTRRQEALNRRLWGIDGPEQSKLGRYLQGVLQELRAGLNLSGRQRLQGLIAEYLASFDVEQFCGGIKQLVDEHQVVVQLPYATARHGPYVRHVPLLDQQRISRALEIQEATARANADLEAERRLEEFGMMPRCGLSSMFWDRELRGGGGGPVFDGGVSQRMMGIRTMAEIGGLQAPSMSAHVPTPPQAMQAMHPGVGRHGVAATRHPYMSVAHLQDTPLSEFLTRYACEPRPRGICRPCLVCISFCGRSCREPLHLKPMTPRTSSPGHKAVRLLEFACPYGRLALRGIDRTHAPPASFCGAPNAACDFRAVNCGDYVLRTRRRLSRSWQTHSVSPA